MHLTVKSDVPRIDRNYLVLLILELVFTHLRRWSGVKYAIFFVYISVLH